MSSATHLTTLFSFANISTSRLMFNPLRGVFCVSNTSFVAVKAIQTSEGIKMKQPKTFGLEWLYLSLASFNGSGYADKSSPELLEATTILPFLWLRVYVGLKMLDIYRVRRTTTSLWSSM